MRIWVFIPRAPSLPSHGGLASSAEGNNFCQVAGALAFSGLSGNGSLRCYPPSTGLSIVGLPEIDLCKIHPHLSVPFSFLPGT